MKNLIASVLFLSVFLFSCKTTKYGTKNYNKENIVSYEKQQNTIKDVFSDGVYTYSEAKRMQDEDVKYMNEHYTEEEIKEFAKMFVYETVVLDGDTIKHNSIER